MKYPVKRTFQDKITKKQYYQSDIYETGDQARAEELQGKKFIGKVMLEPDESVQDCDPPISELIKHVGGGYYELPNGKRIKGREDAEKALIGGEDNDVT